MKTVLSDLLPSKNKAESISSWIMLGLVFLAPFFFVPSTAISFLSGKLFFISILVVVATALFAIARLREGTVGFVRNPLYLCLFITPVFFILATLFSGSRMVSFVGHGFEVGTLAAILIFFLVCYLASELFISVRAGVLANLAFLLSFIIVALFHLIRLFFGPSVLSFGIFTVSASSFVGSWNDVGIYFGAVALMSFVSLEFLELKQWLKWVLAGALVISLFMVSVVNFHMVWYVIAIFSVLFFVYRYTSRGSSDRAFPVVPLVILIIACLFILIKGNIYYSLSNQSGIQFLNKFVVSNIEVRPSPRATGAVVWQAIKQHPLLGTGPNRFVTQWLTSKPDAINTSQFWGTDFNYGIGLIPTFLVTVGPLGFLAFVAFIILFFWLGFKVLFIRHSDSLRDYLVVSTFIAASYLWIFSIFYVPSAAMLFLTFFFTGSFLATLSGSHDIPRKVINLARSPRSNFISVLVFIIILLGLLVCVYGLSRQFISGYYYNKGLSEANTKNNLTAAETNLNRAISLSASDQYYRTVSELNLVKINILLSDKTTSQDVLKNQFRSYVALAQSASMAAKDYDPTNYENWLSLGRVYESIVPFSPKEAFTQAEAAYFQARILNPKNPAIYLVLARLEVVNNNIPKAKEYIASALKLKSDYTEAIFFLSQIQVNEGDIKSAIESVQAATLVTPNDPGVYFQLGLLKYNNKDYSGAAGALEVAIRLTPDYANARYFLGLSYFRLGKTTEALAQFTIIQKTNPDNDEVKNIISNIKAGKDPFANVQAPLDNKPEKRATPPVKEKAVPTDTESTDVTTSP